MKTYDLTPLKSNDVEYGEAVESVVEYYRGDWDDEIHDSYMRYVKQVQEQSQKIHVIRCKAETLKKEVEGLNVEELKQIADSLCREADSV